MSWNPKKNLLWMIMALLCLVAAAGTFGQDQSDGPGPAPQSLQTQSWPNQPPDAVDDWFGTLWETPIAIPYPTLLANDSDPDGDPLTVCDVGDPQHGTLGPGLAGVTYTPPAGCAVGLDSFKYTVCDGRGGKDTATVWITIGGIICPSSE